MNYIKHLFQNQNFISSIVLSKKLLLTLISLTGIFIIRKIFNGPKTSLKPNVAGKVIIVTGASEGLGEEIALQLLKNGATVIFACRDEEKFNKIIQNKLPKILKNENNKNNEDDIYTKLKDNAIFIKLDLSDFLSVKNFCEIFSSKYQQLDILINNAAVINKNFRLSKSDLTEETLQINTFSHVLLTYYLKVHLQASNGKVINLTGKIFKACKYKKAYFDSINPETYESECKSNYSAFGQYAFSKLGNFYFTKYSDKKWFLKSAVVHPGVIMTKISRDLDGIWYNIAYVLALPLFWLFAKSKFMGAQSVLHLCYAEGKEFESGQYYENNAVCAVVKEVDNEEKMSAFIDFARRIINFYGKCKGISFDG